jgi:hypothetical protein
LVNAIAKDEKTFKKKFFLSRQKAIKKSFDTEDESSLTTTKKCN